MKDCFKSNLRAINADQPLNDVYAQVKSFVSRQARSAAPCTPRVLILGPTCSGRKTAAKQIADKYDLPIGEANRSARHACRTVSVYYL